MIIIIDCGIGNLFSVYNALKFIGERVKISNHKNDIQKADKLILPGVGAFSEGIRNLKKSGLSDLLTKEVIKNKKPILGICLGMQLFAEKGTEGGTHTGLGWIKNSSVEKIESSNPNIKIPHIGWNNVFFRKSLLFKGFEGKPDFYFVHSYYLNCSKDIITSSVKYENIFTASVEIDNIFGTQFHPEKSQKNGLKLLKNFTTYKND